MGRWTQVYTETCEATHVRGDQSAEVLDLRMDCLGERLASARALSDVLAGADGQVVDNAVAAASALPMLARCSDVPMLRAVIERGETVGADDRMLVLERHGLELAALQ